MVLRERQVDASDYEVLTVLPQKTHVNNKIIN